MKLTSTCCLALLCCGVALSHGGQESDTMLAWNPQKAGSAKHPMDMGDMPQSVPVPEKVIPTRKIGTLEWHTDYASAYHAARKAKQMLVIVFEDARHARVNASFERTVLANPHLARSLSTATRVVLPLSAQRPLTTARKPERLIDHTAFEFMYGRPGVAMIDLTDSRSELFGAVVSAHPFLEGSHLTLDSVRVVLNLPRGTVTQRALVYAVLMHPAAPVSTTGGACHTELCRQARRGSELMAQFGSVGHHEWGERSAMVSARTGRGASEVAASSWGASTLQDAAEQCVNSWYGSPSHWGIMSSPATLYGYDLVRSSNGMWYGTGVFAN